MKLISILRWILLFDAYVYTKVYTNTCLQCCIKGHLPTDTEYSLGVQQKRIRKAREKKENQNIDQKKGNN